VLLSTPGNMTFPVVIWSVWNSGGLGRASAALVCFIVCVLPFMALYVIVLQRPENKNAASASLAVGNAS